MCRTKTTKEVTCPDCGQSRRIRSDSTAIRCAKCVQRRGGRAPKPSRRRGQNRTCDGCGAKYWWRPSEGSRRFCSPTCGTTARRRPDKAQKVRARNEANAARATGRLVEQPCEVCGTTDHLEMHHEDYSKPLEVRWLCERHHTVLHVARGDLKAQTAGTGSGHSKGAD